MDSAEVKAETVLVEEVKQPEKPEPEKQTNGEQNGEQNGKESTPASTTEDKKETTQKETGKDSKGDSETRPRRERTRTRPNRRRSRSPVRSREEKSSKASRSVYVANFPFDVSVVVTIYCLHYILFYIYFMQVKWTELKDLFKEKIGANAVKFVQLFENEEGKVSFAKFLYLRTNYRFSLNQL